MADARSPSGCVCVGCFYLCSLIRGFRRVGSDALEKGGREASLEATVNTVYRSNSKMSMREGISKSELSVAITFASMKP